MKTNCMRCNREYETIKGFCKECYERQIFKGQCLNIAGTIVGGMMADPNFEIKKELLPTILFNLAREIYEEGQKSCPKECKENHVHKQRFLEWE